MHQLFTDVLLMLLYALHTTTYLVTRYQRAPDVTLDIL